jgi:hypothetical protein
MESILKVPKTKTYSIIPKAGAYVPVVFKSDY